MKYIAKRFRINLDINSPTVRLIGNEGEQLGIMSLEKAVELAKSKEMDLVEVAGSANPPVCKIMDYGKHQYHKRKVETKHRKGQKKTTVKGVRIGFKTGAHDLKTKEKQALKFLKAGNSVKVSLIFKGREIIYKNLAIDKMMEFYENIKEDCTLETPPKGQGNTLIMMITPIK